MLRTTDIVTCHEPLLQASTGLYDTFMLFPYEYDLPDPVQYTYRFRNNNNARMVATFHLPYLKWRNTDIGFGVV